MSLLRVGITVLALVPFALIEDLRQDQSGLDRIQRLALVEDFVVCIRASAEKIRDEFAGANFSDNPRSQAVPGTVDGDQLNFWKLFAELVEQRFGAVAADVEIELTFFLCRCDGFFPDDLPRRFPIGRTGQSREQWRYNTYEADNYVPCGSRYERYFHHFALLRSKKSAQIGDAIVCDLISHPTA